MRETTGETTVPPICNRDFAIKNIKAIAPTMPDAMTTKQRLKTIGTFCAALLGGIPVGAGFFLVVYGTLELLLPWQTAAWITLPMAVVVWGLGVWFCFGFLRVGTKKVT